MRNRGERREARQFFIRDALSISIALPQKLQYKTRKLFAGFNG